MNVHLPHPLTGELFDSPVPPGAGWPEDPGAADAPVARTSADVASLAREAGSLAELESASSVCRACPRLVDWREGVAVEKRRAFAAEPYWGGPSPAGAPRRLAC